MEARSIRVMGTLALALVLGGCIAAPQPAPLANEEERAPQVPPGVPAGVPEANVAPAALEVTPFSYQGTTDTAACYFVAVTAQCQGADGPNSLYVIDVAGEPQRLTAAFTWTAATPATMQLNVFLLSREGEGWVWNQGDPMASGSSPLTLDAELAALGASGHAIAVNAFQGAGAGVVFAGATLPQDFAVEGTVTTLPGATG